MKSLETYGSEILKKISKPVTTISEDIKLFAEEMLTVMNNEEGIGLAAPQVGKNIRMFVLGVPESEDQNKLGLSPAEIKLLPKMPLVFINTEIISRSSETVEREEGCLSIPKIYAPVERPKSIKFKTTLIDGQDIMLEASGLLARAIQHELDHLNGILFVDKIKVEDFVKLKKKLKVMARRNK